MGLSNKVDEVTFLVGKIQNKDISEIEAVSEVRKLIRDRFEKEMKQFLAGMLRKLYANDRELLKRDYTKAKVLNEPKVVSEADRVCL